MSGPEMSKAQVNAADELLGPTLKCGGANKVAILFGDAKFTYGELRTRRAITATI